MSKIKFVIIFIFLSQFIFAQVPSYKWAGKIKDFSSLWNGPTDVKTDALGNVYVTGRFVGVKDFDMGPGVFTLSPPGSSTNSDIFILKLDSLGNFIWAKQIGGNNTEVASNLAIDGAGNLLLSGLFHQSADFDPGPLTYTLSTSGSFVWNSFVLKLDANGNFIFVKQVPADWGSIGISTDPMDNILLTGSFSGTADLDPGTGVFNVSQVGNNDAFVLKLDANGNFIWAKAFGSVGVDEGCCVKSDIAGNVFVSGNFEAACNFGSTTNLTPVGDKDIFLLKLNSAGNFQWVKTLGGASVDRVQSIAVDSSGSLFAAGYFYYSCDMNTGTGIITFTAPVVNAFLLKLDSNGNYSWSKQYGDSASSVPCGVLLDKDENVYTIGYFYGSGDFDPGPGSAVLSSPGTANNTFISKLDNNGNSLWLGSLGGSSQVEAKAMAMDHHENMYILGTFFGPADLNPGILVDTLHHEGPEENMFIAGYGKCLEPLSPAFSGPTPNLMLCDSGMTTLSVAGTGTVNWYTSPYSAQSIATGTMFSTSQLTTTTTFYADDNTSCAKSINRTAFTISVSPTPTITISSSNTLICVGESATLTAAGANTYTWGETFNSETFVVVPLLFDSIPYTYSVIGTDVNGCMNSKSATIYTQLCLEVDRLESGTSEFRIYPTPFQDLLTIEIGNHQSARITITNSLGQILKQEKIISEQRSATIDVRDLAEGTYFINLVSEEFKSINKKILKINRQQ